MALLIGGTHLLPRIFYIVKNALCASYHHLGIVNTAVPKILVCSRFTSLYIYSALTKLRENVSDFRHRGGTSMITTLGGARFWMFHVATLHLLRLKERLPFSCNQAILQYLLPGSVRNLDAEALKIVF